MFEERYVCPRCLHPIGGGSPGDPVERCGDAAGLFHPFHICPACGLYLCPPPDESRFRAYGRRPGLSTTVGASS